MVKNTTGGSGAKGMARKNTMQSSGRTNSKLRTAEQEGEIYAVITKMSGGGLCIAQCIDGHTRTCIIRGKFKGKGKRDNIIAPGSWVLVGAREWESDKSNSTKELNKCDLMEIYSDSDKKRLQASIDANWEALVINTGENVKAAVNVDDLLNFQTDAEADYMTMMDGLLKEKSQTIAVIGISSNDGSSACDDIIDIDAI